MTAQGPNKATLLFVDEIIDGGDADVSRAGVGVGVSSHPVAPVARVLLDEQALLFPLALLPVGVREGDWVELSARVVPPPPSAAESIRERLVRDDPGGPLKL